MKIVGLITEYNPFHNGHKYHIEKAKKITGADYVIAVMSGDFVQRGAPAIMPKHLRTEMALHGGCDMVIELPVRYATGSAEYFASGAIEILDGLGCVDAICFGSECGDYSSLEQIAKVLAEEPDDYKLLLQNYLKAGYNFPSARQNALENYFHDDKLSAVIKEPNNILGIEYIKAMLSRNSSMKGYTITRKGSSYHNDELSEKYSSASAIRKSLAENKEINFNLLKGQLPEFSLTLMKENYGVRLPVYLDDFSLILRYKLLSETRESLLEYQDITPDLANRIINLKNSFLNFTQFCELLKTKELTYSRINRCLIHILLNIRKYDCTNEAYAHVLGFKAESNILFSVIKKNSKIPIITKLILTNILSSEIQQMLLQDISASNLYESIISDKYQLPFINELSKQIVKV